MSIADQESAALVAQALAQAGARPDVLKDALGVNVQDPSDEDYAQTHKPKMKGKHGRSGRPRASPALTGGNGGGSVTSAETAPAEGGGEVVLSASGRRKRRDTGSQREQSRGWSEEEDARFMAALDIYGRQWRKVADHVGTRDARAITSHAQKFFIKLAIAGKPLPPRVAETGPGYTLSGRPLDPASAAARAYGLKPDVLAKMRRQGVTKLPGFLQTGDADPGRETDASLMPETSYEGLETGEEARQATPEGPVAKRRRTVTSARPGRRGAEATPSREAAVSPEPTISTRSRGRPGPARPATPTGPAGMPVDPMGLLQLQEYTGAPLSGPGAQPYHLEVDSQAHLRAHAHCDAAALSMVTLMQLHLVVHLVMDFHVHLSQCEVTGLLGGHWDPDTHVLHVRQAFPCRRAVGSQVRTLGDMDASAEVQTLALMKDRGLQPVGWYHSHPVSTPRPSQRDAESQHKYQALLQCTKTHLEPFVAAIVSPYDPELPNQASAFLWFAVQRQGANLCPFNVRHVTRRMRTLPAADGHLYQQLISLIHVHKSDFARINPTSVWRPFGSMLNSAKVGGPCSRLDKLRLACLCHLPKGVEDASLKWAWLTQLAWQIQDCWGLDLGITQDAAGKTAPPAALSMAAWATSPAAGSGRHRSVFIDRHAAGHDVVPSPALSGTAYSETQDMRDVSNERMPILIIPPLNL